MFKSKATQNLDFVSRQLAGLLDREALEPALQKLAGACPPEYARDLEHLRSLLAGDGVAGPRLGPNPYRTMARLMPSSSEPKGAFFRGFVSYVQQSKVVFDTYWSGVVSLAWYLAALAAIALVVSLMFFIWVIPEFVGVYTNAGADLPRFTQIVFGLGNLGIPLFAVVLALVTAGVVVLVSLLHRRIQQLSPLPRWPSWTPIVGKLVEYYNLGLFLNFLHILRSSGVPATQAVAQAAEASKQPDSLTYEQLGSGGQLGQFPVLTELGIAARLDQFDAELEHQCDLHMGNLSLVLLEARDQFSLVLKLALYALVATLVIAMYLPIFQIGAVI